MLSDDFLKIHCDGSCKYQPTNPEDIAKAINKLLERYTISELAKILNITESYIKQSVTNTFIKENND